jgi:2-aminoadipate transaminase
MFVWAEGPPGTDIPKLYDQALSGNIAFVPGRYFFADTSRGGTTMRLNFTSSHPEVLRKAVRALSELIQ